jgi:hypothetical protein
MMDRIRQAFRRRGESPTDALLRPNELRREIVRAERLRREAMRQTPPLGQPPRFAPPESQREQGAVAPTLAPRQNQSPAPSIASLRSPGGLRRALLQMEILGPPMGLRNPREGRYRR